MATHLFHHITGRCKNCHIDMAEAEGTLCPVEDPWTVAESRVSDSTDTAETPGAAIARAARRHR